MFSFNITEELRSKGFARIMLPESAEYEVASIYRGADAFFNSSDENKQKCALPLDLGYRAVGKEFSNSPEVPDALESIVFSNSGCVDNTRIEFEAGFDLYQRMSSLSAQLELVAFEIASEIALEVGGEKVSRLPKTAFRKWSQLQLNYSRPDATDGAFINELHEDGHFLTLLTSNGPGLEIRTPNNEFVSITPRANEVIIMPGLVLSMMTGWQIAPLYHQVRKLSLRFNRKSILYFADFEPSKCEPWVISTNNTSDDICRHIRTNSSRFGVSDLPVD